MPASTPTTYLITGAARGLGRGLLEALIQRPNTTIIAGVRDLFSSNCQSLLALTPATESSVIPVLISSTDHSTPAAAIHTLRDTGKIIHIDVVIACAGISEFLGPASITPVSAMRNNFETNTIGVLTLFQAVLPLLKASPNTPTFVALSSGLASLTLMEHVPMPVTAHGISKIALNYMIRKIHFENPELVAFVLSPGWVKTDMGNAVAKACGMDEPPVELDVSIEEMLGKIDGATREERGGKFLSFDEEVFLW